MEDTDGETILHHEYFLLKRKFSEEGHVVSFFVPVFDPMPPQVRTRCVCARMPMAPLRNRIREVLSWLLVRVNN